MQVIAIMLHYTTLLVSQAAAWAEHRLVTDEVPKYSAQAPAAARPGDPRPTRDPKPV